MTELGPPLSLSPTLQTGPVVQLSGADGPKLTPRLAQAHELALVQVDL
jgi:hypothetical protein